MKVIDINVEDLINYKKISMFIATPYCSGKCWKELNMGCELCQNYHLQKSQIIDIQNETIINMYLNNILSKALVFGGMEPFDSWTEVKDFISLFRTVSNDDIVIYTGYKEDELEDKIKILSSFKNIIIKFGRYIPNQEKHYDQVLGVSLASTNQYAKKLAQKED